MRMMLVLVTLLWLAAHPAMASAPDDMVLVPAGEFYDGEPGGRSRRKTGAQGPYQRVPSWISMK